MKKKVNRKIPNKTRKTVKRQVVTEGQKRFSLHHLFIKLSCRRLWIWVVATMKIFFILLKTNGQDFRYINTLVIGSIIISVAYFLSDSIDQIAVIVANRTDVKIGK